VADRLFGSVTAGAAWLVLIILGAAAASMAWGGRLAFETFGWRFITSREWDAVGGHFGAFVPIVGTLVTSAIALLIAVPVSVGIALFLTDIAPRWLRTPIAIAIELLAAIPSIIYGMWGLFVFAPFMAAHVEPWLGDKLGQVPVIGSLFSGPPIGIGMLTAGIVLGIMVIPFISAVARDVFNAVPASLKEAAVALGSTRWEILSRVTLPYTRSAIIGAIFLGLGRALGETMAVTFVLGNAHDLSASLLMPSNSIAAAIANEFTEADTDLYRSSLIALAFLLFVVTFLVLCAAKLMLMRIGRVHGRTH
jgi:phosphate transport system permease protein